ncbi:sugar ABC transporter ATP-binding protein [Streptomyces sp. KR80]|uniref:sugar ABC transporter ATP-binding protein n=1 Tax=Streptomyces sp. KR80 TaxID=3457426 RepID=UPI003FD4CA03
MMVPATGPVLSMQGITKRFFGTTVLDGVSLTCHSGEVHAIVGANGAGKSTLIKVLGGVYQPDGGQLVLDGKPVRFRALHHALARGIGVIHQEFTLLPERSVADNILLGREPRHRLAIDRKAMHAQARCLLSELDAEQIPTHRLVRRLTVAQRQTVEIAKGLSHRPRILVMDEPTAALAPADVTALFRQVRRLVARGLAVLYISHRLDEVFQLADRVTVLRDGQHVTTKDVSAVNAVELVRLMVGRDLAGRESQPPPPARTGPVRLAVRGGQGRKLSGIDLEVRGGEVVGVGGLDGSGRSDLARAVFGVDPFHAAAVEVDGRRLRIRSPRAAIRAGIGYVSADRKTDGLVLPLPATDNALLAVRALGRHPTQEAGGTLSRLAQRVGLATELLRRESRVLSGGSQQKVVLMKWLATHAGIYLFDEPTRGVDIGAKTAIHELIRELADAGAAILLISSELPELVALSHRIVVMHRGVIAGELPTGASEEAIMLLATGQGGSDAGPGGRR